MKVLSIVVACILGLVTAADQKQYDSQEKQRFIYGRPTDDDYGKTKTPEQLKEYESMWETDLGVQKFRGAMQGFYRGLYKTYDWEIADKCLSRQTVKEIYYINRIASNFEIENFLRLYSLIYNIYFNVDYECNIENTLFDLSCFCFDHNCGWEQLLQNEMGKVFQVTGALNALAAAFYDNQPGEDQHVAWFDLFGEVGLNVGKVARYTLDFKPKEIKY